ncbi:MAG: hypothetical protein RLZZ196_2813 [Bacteroidota bacterium]
MFGRKKRKPNFKTLKKKAPKIPDFTCPDIDHIISYVEDKDLLNRTQLAYFKRRMEKLRNSNDKLRDSGIYWYDITKDLLDK